MIKIKRNIIPIICSLALFTACGAPKTPTNNSTSNAPTTVSSTLPDNKASEKPEKESKKVPDLKDKKVYYIDSYNTDFPWSVDLTEGIEKILKPTNAQLKIFRMDTKNHTEPTWGTDKAKEILKEIEEYKPDLIICSDDAAVKFVIRPHFKDSEIPVVSIGVNWNLDAYEMPYKNTAAMVEYTIDEPIFKHMKKFAKGDRIGFISGDSLTAEKSAKIMPELFNVKWEKTYLVKDFEEFKAKWTALQDEVDMILFDNTGGIKGWDPVAAKEFCINNSKIPSGAHYIWCTDMTLLGITEVGQEHGEWAGTTAVSILSGEKKVSDIKITKNKEGTLTLNMAMAKKLGVQFEPNLLENAKIIN